LDLDLKGKVALVTGSSRGIGFAIAKGLVDEGCTVVLNGLQQDSLLASAVKLGVTYLQGDVSRSADSLAIIDKLVSNFGRLDILVANVGSGASVKGGMETRDEWIRMLELNLLSTTSIVDAARPVLVASKGVILCISSICGVASLGAPIAYSAAKAALNSYVKGISSVLGPEGVRINGLAPGNVLFPGSTWERKLQEDKDFVEAMLKTQVPLGRFARPGEISDIAVFLCSKRAEFMTGSIVIADGGQVQV